MIGRWTPTAKPALCAYAEGAIKPAIKTRNSRFLNFMQAPRVFELFRRGCSKTRSLYCAYTLVYTFFGMNTTLLLAQLLETVDRDFLVNDPVRTLREIAQKLDRVVERHRHELTKVRKPNAKRGPRPRPVARKA